jgi:hypothetical protein
MSRKMMEGMSRKMMGGMSRRMMKIRFCTGKISDRQEQIETITTLASQFG